MKNENNINLKNGSRDKIRTCMNKKWEIYAGASGEKKRARSSLAERRHILCCVCKYVCSACWFLFRTWTVR